MNLKELDIGKSGCCHACILSAVYAVCSGNRGHTQGTGKKLGCGDRRMAVRSGLDVFFFGVSYRGTIHQMMMFPLQAGKMRYADGFPPAKTEGSAYRKIWHWMESTFSFEERLWKKKQMPVMDQNDCVRRMIWNGI
jgi:hypothetical protein